jgi:predicted ATPase
LLTRVLGRDEAVTQVSALLKVHRFVTVVGAGGIGKTTVAISVAERLSSAFADGQYFVDLSPLVNPTLVMGIIGCALGLPSDAASSLASIRHHFSDREALLILDNCEHVLETLAPIAEAILKTCPRMHILATSRESVRAEGEWVYRLASLDTPPPGTDMSAQELLKYSAVQLFAERTAAASGSPSLSDSDALIVAEICRRLDGLPLAIELAAATVVTYGLHGLASRLNERLALLAGGRRTALPRHQTLRAMLDWSYGLLSARNQIALRRVSIFSGSFTLDSAAPIATDDELSREAFFEALVALTGQSLLNTDSSDTTLCFRLLETTRLYARERLIEAAEFNTIARRHAEYFRDSLSGLRRPVPRYSPYPVGSSPVQQLGEMRAALEWAYSPTGDASLAVSLTVAAVPIWFNLSFERECADRVDQAIASLGEQRDRENLAKHRMQLYAARGAALVYSVGAVPELESAWLIVADLAEQLNDDEHRMKSLWGLWVHRLRTGRHREAMEIAKRFNAQVTSLSDSDSASLAARLLGISLHYTGSHGAAREHLERAVSRYREPAAGSSLTRFHVGPLLLARVPLARVLWILGLADKARELCRSVINDATAGSGTTLLSYLLSDSACMIALATGDLVTAERYEVLLRDSALRTEFAAGAVWYHCFKGVRLIKSGDRAGGLALLRDGIQRLNGDNLPLSYMMLLAEFSLALGQEGAIAEAAALLDEAIKRCETHCEEWIIPELLRVRGELRLWNPSSKDETSAEADFMRSLEMARSQRALMLELRTGLSVARLWRGQGRATAALDVLKPVCAQFVEGFTTSDFLEALMLIEELEGNAGVEERKQ